MMEYDVKGHLRNVLADLPQGVRLVAISKYHPNEYIQAAYDEGQRIFGESHEQELRQKVETLPRDIQWHFIGHLQTNKVKYIAPYITMIEAVDSFKLLKEIDMTNRQRNADASLMSSWRYILLKKRRNTVFLLKLYVKCFPLVSGAS